MFSFKKLFNCNYYNKNEKKILKKKIQKSFIFGVDNDSSSNQNNLDSSIYNHSQNIKNKNNTNDSNDPANIFDLFNNLSPTIKDHILLEYGNVDIIYRDLYNELNSVRCQNLNHHYLTSLVKNVINNQMVLDYIYYKDKLFNKYYNIYFTNHSNKNNNYLFDDLCERLCIDWINDLYNKDTNLYSNVNAINTNINDSIDSNDSNDNDDNIGLDIGI